MKKQQKEMPIKFNNPFFKAFKRCLPDILEGPFNEKGCKVRFEQFINIQGVYFAILLGRLPDSNKRMALCLDDLFDMDSALNGKVKPKQSSANLWRQSRGDVFIKLMKALKFTNPQYDEMFWAYYSEKIIPSIDDTLFEYSNAKFKFHAITNENDTPMIFMENEVTGEILKITDERLGDNEFISAKFNHQR